MGLDSKDLCSDLTEISCSFMSCSAVSNGVGDSHPQRLPPALSPRNEFTCCFLPAGPGGTSISACANHTGQNMKPSQIPDSKGSPVPLVSQPLLTGMSSGLFSFLQLHLFPFPALFSLARLPTTTTTTTFPHDAAFLLSSVALGTSDSLWVFSEPLGSGHPPPPHTPQLNQSERDAPLSAQTQDSLSGLDLSCPIALPLSACGMFIFNSLHASELVSMTPLASQVLHKTASSDSDPREGGGGGGGESMLQGSKSKCSIHLEAA